MNLHNDPRVLEDKMVEVTKGSFVMDRDRTCRKCKYDLTGLRYGDACPECAKKILYHTAMESRIEKDRLADTPRGYIRLVQFAFYFLSFGCLAMLGIAMLAFRSIPPWAYTLLTPLVLLWVAGVGILCLPFPSTDIVTRKNNDKFLLRFSSFATQCLWLPAYALAMATPWSSTIFGLPLNIVLARTLVVVAFLGVGIFNWIPASIAEWMSDSDTGPALRRRTFWSLVIICFTLAGGTIMVPVALGNPVWMIRGINLVTIFLYIIIFLFMFTFARLGTQAAWCIRESLHRQGKLETLQARREAGLAAAQEEADNRPHNPPVTKLWQGEARRGNW